MCWMLLGVNDVVVRRWRDERVLDGGYCDACARGENRQGTSRVAGSRCWSYRRTGRKHEVVVFIEVVDGSEIEPRAVMSTYCVGGLMEYFPGHREFVCDLALE